MTWLEALILGIIQGLTEFLPVSSSGHLEIGSALLGLQGSNNLLFAVVVHVATALSTTVVFRKDIGQTVMGLVRREPESWSFGGKILLSMIPVGVVGILWEDEIEAFFTGNMALVGSMLLVTALLLLLSQILGSGKGEVSYGKAIIMGIAQAIAILPGISRSGATISAGLIFGVDRSLAARFSFLMVLIPILGAGLLKLKDYLEAPDTSVPALVLVVGFVAAFGSGYLACTWMIALVKRARLGYFAAYCAIVGLFALLLQWL
jgi:undecaprenyl-diphosphatase